MPAAAGWPSSYSRAMQRACLPERTPPGLVGRTPGPPGSRAAGCRCVRPRPWRLLSMPGRASASPPPRRRSLFTRLAGMNRQWFPSRPGGRARPRRWSLLGPASSRPRWPAGAPRLCLSAVRWGQRTGGAPLPLGPPAPRWASGRRLRYPVGRLRECLLGPPDCGTGSTQRSLRVRRRLNPCSSAPWVRGSPALGIPQSRSPGPDRSQLQAGPGHPRALPSGGVPVRSRTAGPTCGHWNCAPGRWTAMEHTARWG